MATKQSFRVQVTEDLLCNLHDIQEKYSLPGRFVIGCWNSEPCKGILVSILVPNAEAREAWKTHITSSAVNICLDTCELTPSVASTFIDRVPTHEVAKTIPYQSRKFLTSFCIAHESLIESGICHSGTEKDVEQLGLAQYNIKTKQKILLHHISKNLKNLMKHIHPHNPDFFPQDGDIIKLLPWATFRMDGTFFYDGHRELLIPVENYKDFDEGVIPLQFGRVVCLDGVYNLHYFEHQSYMRTFPVDFTRSNWFYDLQTNKHEIVEWTETTHYDFHGVPVETVKRHSLLIKPNQGSVGYILVHLGEKETELDGFIRLTDKPHQLIQLSEDIYEENKEVFGKIGFEDIYVLERDNDEEEEEEEDNSMLEFKRANIVKKEAMKKQE